MSPQSEPLPARRTAAIPRGLKRLEIHLLDVAGVA